jgi:serine/threonine protein kinase
MHDKEPGPRGSAAPRDDTLSVAGPAAPARPPAAPVPAMPASIGPYRIIGPLGEGGMGVVWEAEQQHPHRRVALKVMRRGHLVDEVHARMFHREAETLGRLKHPHIAAIYESGHTDDGHDYFAMELVRGATLDDWLQGRPPAVTPEELAVRLALMRAVCEAVHYAHQRGVIHRDLKPSNIIVTDESTTASGAGGPALPGIKILDFGLARLTDVETPGASMLTEVGMIKGTLPYMAPEQARGETDAIDVRTDVYALGVILYELLAGRRPYEVARAALVEAVRVICEQPPRPLGESWSGTRRLDGDIETIVGKALEKEPEQRYGSAAALAEDLGRYLASQPILARPPSLGYQLRKAFARNQLAFAFAGTALVLLVAFALSMSVLYRRSEANLERAQAAEARARANFGLARDAVDRYLDRVTESPDLKAAGLEPLRRDLLATAQEFYRKLAARGGGTAALRTDLAVAQWRLADVYRAMGESGPAETAYRQGIAAFAALLKADPGNAGYRHDQASIRSNLGMLYTDLGRWPDAEREFRAGLAGIDVSRERFLAAILHDRLAILYQRVPKVPESERESRAGIALREALAEADPSPINRNALVESYINLGMLYAITGRPAEAETWFRKGVPLADGLAAARPGDPLYANAQASTHGNLAGALVLLGRLDEARIEYGREVGPREELVRTHPRVIDYILTLGGAYTNLGELEVRAGRPAAALPWLARGVDTLERLLAVEPRHAVGRYYLSYTQGWRARALAALGRRSEALQAWDAALRFDDRGDPALRKARALAARAAGAPAETPARPGS